MRGVDAPSVQAVEEERLTDSTCTTCQMQSSIAQVQAGVVGPGYKWKVVTDLSANSSVTRVKW